MNKMKFSKMLSSFLLTLLIFVLFEIIAGTFLPMLGWHDHRLSFNVIVILYIAIRVSSLWLPWMILILEVFHSAFSIEGWALGTLCGLIIVVIVNYLKDLIQLSSAITTIVIAQIFQLIWMISASTIICLKLSNFNLFGSLIWQFLPSSLLLSLLTPIVFQVFELIWMKAFETSTHHVEI